MSTTQEIAVPPFGKTEGNSSGNSPDKPAGRRSSRRKKGHSPQRAYDHIPIIIFLLVIFSFSLLCIGIGLTHYLDSERAGIPACSRTPCAFFSAPVVAQKGGGE
ncbi:MAG: hypothetical protein D3908_05465 [Candidatus Electrothrix sp. AUS4]|nr:hypothetical protein [Candidatus Electrothrix sp. AUS4]